ncbi:hypothetical protein H2198_005780 [Neophaeococcomyces mojaviensis]|uniref:Uncharacterized protein n=1 Tax=Neophaeococcomyces mojaviensis TaxID=3383035 RepID=A0ACC3A571_9EURO|nr:hypothetical protein H2198_005780 [Knufia sp. JES_112]
MAKRTHFVAVGACAIDTILTVPFFPSQDSKLRATSLTKRRGGNGPNTLEVLQQLVQYEAVRHDRRRASTSPLPPTQALSVPTLSLIAPLPAKDSLSVQFMKSSFDLMPVSTRHIAEHSGETVITTPGPEIDFSHCLHREEHLEPVSSYIISDSSTSSRTIVNYNALQEMTYLEFTKITDSILQSSLDGLSPEPNVEEVQFWFHFEGRIPDVTLQCVKHLRSVVEQAQRRNVDLRISVELEKPGREGLQELAEQADVVFYSRSWAEHEGYNSAEECIRQQAQRLKTSTANIPDRILICTWGASGACATIARSSDVIHSPAYKEPAKQIVDTTGAGDTFIAGMLFAFLYPDRTVTSHLSESLRGEPPEAKFETVQWSLKQKLGFANELAGRKILQDGFGGLGKAVEQLVTRLDNREEI